MNDLLGNIKVQGSATKDWLSKTASSKLGGNQLYM
jgi:hypothetical protein